MGTSIDRWLGQSRTQLIQAMMAIGAFVQSFACATVSISAEPNAIVSKIFVFEKAPFPECHASTIAATPKGLVAAWFGGTEEKDPDVGIWMSHLENGAKSWSPPSEIFNGIQYEDENGKAIRYPCWNPVLTRAPSGELYLFYKVGPSPSEWWGMVSVSRDDGATWGEGIRLPEGILGPIKNKPHWLPDQTLLCPTSTEAGGPWRVYFELTQLPFQKWKRTSLLATADHRGGIQPTILHHPDGKLQALCRCDGEGNRILETWSSDQGKHWTELTATQLPNPNSGIDAITLADGRHCLIYNHTERGSKAFPRAREMLNVAISRDGKNWEACETLERAEKSEFSYPAIVQAADGRIHVTYTWNRKKIAHVVLDPAKLSGKPIQNGEWPETP